PGNWDRADMGGTPQRLNITPASKLKIALEEIKKAADRIGWKTMLEADHHGPSGEVPLVFVEIGSGEEEWADQNAAAAMASAISASLSRNEIYETCLGFGGGHYPKSFTKLILDGSIAISHIAPKYVIDSIDETMFAHAIERSVEKISKVIILKDETNTAQKEKINGFATKLGLVVEMV
ncbi:MAG: hypothetical protein HZC29_07580, partial [Thaumarchaeota archaeon]|nr:hypothetical protein [Nitrososphaerota archaeon]